MAHKLLIDNAGHRLLIDDAGHILLIDNAADTSFPFRRVPPQAFEVQSLEAPQQQRPHLTVTAVAPVASRPGRRVQEPLQDPQSDYQPAQARLQFLYNPPTKPTARQPQEIPQGDTFTWTPPHRPYFVTPATPANGSQVLRRPDTYSYVLPELENAWYSPLRKRFPVNPPIQVVLTTNGTWTANTTLVTVECWGGGAGAGGGGTYDDGEDAVGTGGGGGGGGAYARKEINTSIGMGFTYGIGPRGNGGLSSPTNGTNGGDTFFGNLTTVLAKGGTGGIKATSGASGAPGVGSNGGLASLSIGDVVLGGGRGANGTFANNNVTGGGGGGSSASANFDGAPGNITVGGLAPAGGGNGGNGTRGGEVTAGRDGSSPGGAGGGGAGFTTGGNGSQGKIVLTYYPVAAEAPATRLPSSYTYTLPEYESSWFQEHRHWPVPTSRAPDSPATRQPNSYTYTMPVYDSAWFQEHKRWPVPTSRPPDNPATRLPSSYTYVLPDYVSQWWQEHRRWPEATSRPIDPTPPRLPNSYTYVLPDYNQQWQVYRRLQPTPVSRGIPATRQPSSYQYTLPEYESIWWQQHRRWPELVTRYSFTTLDVGEGGILASFGAGVSGAYRIANDITGYNVWVGNGTLPDLNGTVTAFTQTLPVSVPITPPVSGNQTFHVIVQAQNKYGIRSTSQYDRTIIVKSDGTQVLPALAVPQNFGALQRSGGIIRVLATYPRVTLDTYPADLWKVWIGTVQPDPNVDAPVYSGAASLSLMTDIGIYTAGLYYVIVGLVRTSDGAVATTSGNVTMIDVPAQPGFVPGDVEIG